MRWADHSQKTEHKCPRIQKTLDLSGRQRTTSQTMLGFHLTLVRMQSLRKQTAASVDKDVERKEPYTRWWRCEVVQSLWMSGWRFLRKPETWLPSPFTLTGIYTSHRHTRSLVSVALVPETAKYPTAEEWGDMVCVGAYVHVRATCVLMHTEAKG